MSENLYRPGRVMTDEVLLREVPCPFGKQNASLHHMLWLAATHNLRTAPNTPVRLGISWNPPLVAASDLYSLSIEHIARCVIFYLPVDSCAFQRPASG